MILWLPSEGQNRPELTCVTSATVQDESPVESWQGPGRVDLGKTGLAFLGVAGTGHDPERGACLLESLSGASARCSALQ